MTKRTREEREIWRRMAKRCNCKSAWTLECIYHFDKTKKCTMRNCPLLKDNK